MDGVLEQRPLLSERLLTVLRREMDALDADEEAPPGGGKGRIDAVGQMTRTLEKLLELKRLEALEARGGDDPDGETVRLRGELLQRLKALDARRRDGAVLFDEDGRLPGAAVSEDPAAGAATRAAGAVVEVA
jgi:hypothetical protein